MALFSDGPLASIDDLTKYDSSLLSAATTEGIDVTAKLMLAQNELQIELISIFQRESSIYSRVLGQAPLDTDHLAVTPALKVWHTFKTLELVYRDAYFSQLNDRYRGKWSEYQDLSRSMRGKFIETGAGLVISPMPQPAAPTFILQPASQPGGSAYVTITFVNSSAEESSPATVTECDVTDGNVIVLIAPNLPINAIGWNVYGGLAPNSLTLQTPIPLAQDAQWQFVLPGTSTGQPPGNGQAPNVIRDLPRRIMRG